MKLNRPFNTLTLAEYRALIPPQRRKHENEEMREIWQEYGEG